MQLSGGYWREDHAGDLERLEEAERCADWHVCFARLQAGAFYRNWRCLSSGCTID